MAGTGSWITPRLWRSPASRFNEDEPLQASAVYTADTLAGIREQGFDAVWLRGRLRDLIRSEHLPELNDPLAPRRLASLRAVLADARRLGMKVFLFFNEPLALDRSDPFWRRHPELAGEPYAEPELGWDTVSFCTSTEGFRSFFRESLANLFADLPGLGGVILITASEFQSHCWSHKARRKVGDVYLDRCVGPMACPRCREREPAEVVAELVGAWAAAAAAVPEPPQVWAWNWSWSIWYDQPQAEVIRRLPPGVRLLADFERGGVRRQACGEVFIDEYALGYAGPGDRFLGAAAAAREAGLPVCAKLQLGTTHELATVPNLPLITRLFAKLRFLDENGAAGLMGSWNFGNSPSLNTAACRLFLDRPDLRRDETAFCRTLAVACFAAREPSRVTEAWEWFGRAFHEYPFSLKMLYAGPMNYAVACPLSLDYQDRPMGPSWVPHHPFGDRLEECLGPFTLDQAAACLGRMVACWEAGLALYGEASEAERACARMIGLHLKAADSLFRFHRWRRERMAALGLTGPCRLEPDTEAGRLRAEHARILAEAEVLASRYPAFGFHQEPGAAFYDAARIAQARRETLQPG